MSHELCQKTLGENELQTTKLTRDTDLRTVGEHLIQSYYKNKNK